MTAATNSHMWKNGIEFKITYSKTSDVVIYHMQISLVQIHLIKFLQCFSGLEKICILILTESVMV